MADGIMVRGLRSRDGEEVKPTLAERRPDTLDRALLAANDNDLAWPLIPMFDGFFGA
jgi:hypothetical protein